MSEKMRRACLSVFFILIMVVCLTLNAFGQTDNNKPYVLDQFKIFIWPFKTDVLTDYGLYRDLNLGGFQVDRGKGQHDRIRFSRENDFLFYAGHVADKGYLYLKGSDKDKVTGKAGLLERPLSLADPNVVKEIKTHIRKNILDLKNGKVVAYALDDEISLGTFTNPADVDISSFSLERFRKWLQKPYKTIADLNRQWGTDFKTFTDVVPQGFEQIRKGLSNRYFSNWNLSPWMDFRQFMDFQFSQVLSELVQYANTIDPDTPAGFVGGQGPSVWGGYDYGRLSRAVQWMEAYDILGTNEILRSFWNGTGKMRMQTFFSKKNWKKDSWFLWYYLVHGNSGAIAWPEGWFETIDGKRQPSKYIQSLKKVFETVQGEASEYIADKNTIFMADPVGIYYSHPSIQAGWAMDAMVHGKTWPMRLSSIDDDNQSSGVLRKVWCKMLEDLGYQYDFINYLDVEESRVDLNKQYKIIILPKTICLSETEIDVFKQFVKSGGVIVADHLCGIFDEHGKWRQSETVNTLFGIQRNDAKGYLNGKGITEIDAEKYKKPFNQRFSYYQGAFDYRNIIVFERGTKSRTADVLNGKKSPDFIIKNKFKKGSTVYLNLSPTLYWSSSKRFSEFGEGWRDIISDIFKSTGLNPGLRIIPKDGPAMIESLFWKNGDNTYLGIVNNPSDNFKQVEGDLTEITLSFNKAVLLKNLRSKKEFGQGKVFKDTFLPWEGNVYLVEFE